MTKDNYTIQTGLIKDRLKSNSDNLMEIAQRVQRVSDLELYKGFYTSLNEYCEKEFGFDRRRVSECLKVVYRFCEKRKICNQYSSGYCVKSLFKKYSYSVLVLISQLGEDEIAQIGITSDMSYRQVKKLVNAYKLEYMPKKLNSVDDSIDILDSDSDDDSVNENDMQIDNVHPYNLKYSEMVFDMDNCYLKNKKLNTHNGLVYLRDMILSDPNYQYAVVKVRKKEN